MEEDVNSVVKECKIIDGFIGITMTELEYIYMLGYVQGKIDERQKVLNELKAIQK